MFKKERQAYILKQINQKQKIISADICQEMNVSEDTIRRDLQELADKGKIIKVHGGALSLDYDESSITFPDNANKDAGAIIARKTVDLIRHGMFIMTSGGSTTAQLAQALPSDLKATFISGSIQAIVEYTRHPSIDVIIIGDKVSKGGKLTVGSEAIAKIKQIKADICLLDVQAIDAVHGVSENDWEAAQIKKAMIESSQKTICLCNAEKINSIKPVYLCTLQHIHTLITELDAGHPLLNPYRAAGIQVI
jgi:DeoR/GlpR family transcriptional regulator of sugar metabolism